MFQKKIVEKIKTLILLSIICFENRAVYEIMWKNNVERGRPQMTTWRMRIECCVTKATNTHSGCVILIPFPEQQWLYERTSMLHYTNIVCLVIKVITI